MLNDQCLKFGSFHKYLNFKNFIKVKKYKNLPIKPKKKTNTGNTVTNAQLIPF